MKKIIFLQALFLALLIILFGFKLTVFNISFYEREFEKNNVYENVPEADRYKDEIIGYLQQGKPLESFNEQEARHMQDVKRIVDVLILLFYLSLIMFVFTSGYLMYEKKFTKNVFVYSSLASIAVIVLIFLLSMNFQAFFIKFHQVFFSNNLWLFSKDSVLVNLFPLEFFKDILIRILAIDFIFSLLILAFGLVKFKSNILFKHNI